MKKIAFSLLTVGLVSAAAIFVTSAYFSDTEVSTGNSIQAGTIDIAVDGKNPWTRTYTESWGDFKPGGHEREMTFVIKNVGENPTNVWKKVLVTNTTTGDVSEPECTDQSGVWTNPDGPCDFTATTDDNDMTPYLKYSMSVGGIMVINPDWGITIGDVNDLWVPLKSLEPGEELTITQTYALDSEADNRFQGDKLFFNIELYAEQYMGDGPTTPTNRGIVLENKTGDPHWMPIIDGVWGILTWDVSGAYHVRAWGLDDTRTYRVAYWDGSVETGVSGYQAPISGEIDYSNTYGGFSAIGAKYWLRPDNWDNSLTLWESNLVN